MEISSQANQSTGANIYLERKKCHFIMEQGQSIEMAYHTYAQTRVSKSKKGIFFNDRIITSANYDHVEMLAMMQTYPTRFYFKVGSLVEGKMQWEVVIYNMQKNAIKIIPLPQYNNAFLIAGTTGFSLLVGAKEDNTLDVLNKTDLSVAISALKGIKYCDNSQMFIGTRAITEDSAEFVLFDKKEHLISDDGVKYQTVIDRFLMLNKRAIKVILLHTCDDLIHPIIPDLDPIQAQSLTLFTKFDVSEDGTISYKYANDGMSGVVKICTSRDERDPLTLCNIIETDFQTTKVNPSRK